jgi:hypothetical protein
LAKQAARFLVAIFLTTFAAHADAQNYRYGIHTYYLSPYLAQKSTELGAGYVRIQIDWDMLQPDGPDDWNDGPLRDWLDAAGAHHFKLYATLANTPGWAGPCQSCMPNSVWDWYGFAYRVMSQARRAYPDVDIVFGIWNEPNLTGPRGFFQGNDADYALLFQFASMARDAANPGARLGAPDLSVGGFGPLIFLDSVMSKIRPYFRERDVLTFHWYPDQGSLPDWVRAIGATSPGREIWLTETGVNTCDDTLQRAWIDYAINTFDYDNPSPLWTRVFVYYLWDAQTNCAANLVRTDGTNRPAYVDYRNRATGASDRLNPISLRAANGKFVTAELGGNGKVMADRVAAGSWETFDLLDLNGGSLIDGDRVAIQTASGLYLQADQGGGRAMLAIGPAPGAWETFTVVDLDRPGAVVKSGDAIALRSSLGYYVSAQIAGTEEITADRTTAGSWETFQLVSR